MIVRKQSSDEKHHHSGSSANSSPWQEFGKKSLAPCRANCGKKIKIWKSITIGVQNRACLGTAFTSGRNYRRMFLESPTDKGNRFDAQRTPPLWIAKFSH